MVNYYSKYLKYKNKYIIAKQNMLKQNMLKQSGGSNEKVNIMLFKADWCGHCKRFTSVWNEMEEKYKKKYNFISYDSDKNKKDLENWGVKSFPTIIIKKGNLASEYFGDRVEPAIIDFISNFEKIKN